MLLRVKAQLGTSAQATSGIIYFVGQPNSVQGIDRDRYARAAPLSGPETWEVGGPATGKEIEKRA